MSAGKQIQRDGWNRKQPDSIYASGKGRESQTKNQRRLAENHKNPRLLTNVSKLNLLINDQHV